jgi:hypothetical protein
MYIKCFYTDSQYLVSSHSERNMFSLALQMMLADVHVFRNSLSVQLRAGLPCLSLITKRALRASDSKLESRNSI